MSAKASRQRWTSPLRLMERCGLTPGSSLLPLMVLMITASLGRCVPVARARPVVVAVPTVGTSGVANGLPTARQDLPNS